MLIFIIRVNQQIDTIGLIEYTTGLKFKKGNLIKFSPTERKLPTIDIIDSELGVRVFRVQKNQKENDLYCSVKELFYGKLIE